METTPIVKPAPQQFPIHRAPLSELDPAWKIVDEYYEAVHVIARDSKPDFAATYFIDGAGVWLASSTQGIVGCIALRPLATIPHSAEIKRLYVQPAFRGHNIAASLYSALELYAREFSLHWLYLDTAAAMTAAQIFYSKLGFEPCPRYNDNPQAALFMRKKLL